MRRLFKTLLLVTLSFSLYGEEERSYPGFEEVEYDKIKLKRDGQIEPA